MVKALGMGLFRRPLGRLEDPLRRPTFMKQLTLGTISTQVQQPSPVTVACARLCLLVLPAPFLRFSPAHAFSGPLPLSWRCDCSMGGCHQGPRRGSRMLPTPRMMSARSNPFTRITEEEPAPPRRLTSQKAAWPAVLDLEDGRAGVRCVAGFRGAQLLALIMCTRVKTPLHLLTWGP